MKRFITVLLCFIIIIGLFSACGADKEQEERILRVELLIESIGTVTLESKNAIDVADSSYEELSEDEKALVRNYELLEQAKGEYDKLVELQPIQEFAAKLLTKCAESFKDPLSIKVHNVWYWQNVLDRYLFTFEITANNGFGNGITAYYGSDVMGFTELTDDEIYSAAFAFSYGLDSGFAKDGITAMQNGDLLDANYIQNYFLKNYSK